jgi:hypothetical protein
MPKPKSVSFDLHVWAKPETEHMTALYTISENNNAVCVDLPLDKALKCLRERLEEAVETV